MNMQSIQMPLLGGLIALHLISDGTVALTPSQRFKTIVDAPSEPNNIPATFDMEGFKIGSEDFSYGVAYRYKHIESMLQWLQQQKLISPIQ